MFAESAPAGGSPPKGGNSTAQMNDIITAYENESSFTVCVELTGANSVILRPILFYITTTDGSAAGIKTSFTA